MATKTGMKRRSRPCRSRKRRAAVEGSSTRKRRRNLKARPEPKPRPKLRAGETQATDAAVAVRGRRWFLEDTAGASSTQAAIPRGHESPYAPLVPQAADSGNTWGEWKALPATRQIRSFSGHRSRPESCSHRTRTYRQILSSRPTDRTSSSKEAAAITKFKDQKKAPLAGARLLREPKTNLNRRQTIIFEEVTRPDGTPQRQASKAGTPTQSCAMKAAPSARFVPSKFFTQMDREKNAERLERRSATWAEEEFRLGKTDERRKSNQAAGRRPPTSAA